MKITNIFRLVPAIIVVLASAVIGSSGTAHAANASMYLVPGSLVVSGADFSIQVRVNSGGQSVNAVQADLTYPTAVLTYASNDSSGSGFDINASSTGGSGNISISRGASGNAPSGDLLVTTLTFHVIGTGAFSIVFQNSSVLLESTGSSDILTTKTNGDFISIAGPLVPVYRMSNSLTRERLFTTSAFERDYAVANYPGWTYEGIGFYGVAAGTAGSVPVYRLSNSITHERLFTTSVSERDNAVSNYPGWTFEGIGFYGIPSGTAGSVPVYRLSNSITHARLFTASTLERNNAVSNYPGWTYEGVGFTAAPSQNTYITPQGTLVPVYRMSNSLTRERLFTTSAFERDYAVANYPGWTYEGIGFYGVAAGTAGSVPVYRLSNSITHARLFTSSIQERDNATTKYPGWTYEGIGFYGVSSDTTGAVPVYRMSNNITNARLFTTSAFERDNALAKYPGWVYEGIGFYAAL